MSVYEEVVDLKTMLTKCDVDVRGPAFRMATVQTEMAPITHERFSDLDARTFAVPDKVPGDRSVTHSTQLSVNDATLVISLCSLRSSIPQLYRTRHTDEKPGM